MEHQKHLFQLPEEIHYLNCAYMSPLLKSVEEAGITGMRLKRNPANIKGTHFFEPAETFKTLAGQLTGARPAQVAIIPSASYGLASAIQNLPVNNGGTAIVVGEEFPSGYNTIKKWCRRHGKKLQVIAAPEETANRGKRWNEMILEAINAQTAVVMLSSVHWTDGTRFNLEAIGDACRRNDAFFIVDGTQSVGAVPIDVAGCNIDALVCAGYKWLLSPYSTGLACYSERLNSGEPLEETWLNRMNAKDFSALTKYSDDYTPGAGRYNMGEYSNFILLPMMNAALQQILEWQPARIAAYSETISAPLIEWLQQNGFGTEGDAYRSPHLFGITLPPGINRAALLAGLERNQIYVSLRGAAIRISVHLFNTPKDTDALCNVLAGVVPDF
jgi:selenocysteine lyase/cysteine desulfurase